MIIASDPGIWSFSDEFTNPENHEKIAGNNTRIVGQKKPASVSDGGCHMEGIGKSQTFRRAKLGGKVECFSIMVCDREEALLRKEGLDGCHKKKVPRSIGLDEDFCHDCDSCDSDNPSRGDTFDDRADDREEFRALVQKIHENIGIDIDTVTLHQGEGLG